MFKILDMKIIILLRSKGLLICVCHINVPVSSIKPFVYHGLFLSGFIQYACRGGSRISEKGVHMYKGVCVCGARFVDFISCFLKHPMKMKCFGLRPNNITFTGYLKMGAGRGFK